MPTKALYTGGGDQQCVGATDPLNQRRYQPDCRGSTKTDSRRKIHGTAGHLDAATARPVPWHAQPGGALLDFSDDGNDEAGRFLYNRKTRIFVWLCPTGL